MEKCPDDVIGVIFRWLGKYWWRGLAMTCKRMIRISVGNREANLILFREKVMREHCKLCGSIWMLFDGDYCKTCKMSKTCDNCYSICRCEDLWKIDTKIPTNTITDGQYCTKCLLMNVKSRAICTTGDMLFFNKDYRYIKENAKYYKTDEAFNSGLVCANCGENKRKWLQKRDYALWYEDRNITGGIRDQQRLFDWIDQN
jgi:hypothetical protein